MRTPMTRALCWLTLISTASIADAGILGPSTYEECVLESMKGVTSDEAARAVQRACRKKFIDDPNAAETKREISEARELEPYELGRLVPSGGQLANAIPLEEYSPAAVRAGSKKGFNTFTFTVRNTNENLTITELVLRIKPDDTSDARHYTITCRIKPQATEVVSTTITPVKAISSWQLYNAKGAEPRKPWWSWN